MIADVFNFLLFRPFYNGFIFLISIIPGHDVGVAVILLTLTVRALLFSVSFKSIKAQVRLRELGPDIEKVKQEFKDDKQKQAAKIMEIYKQEGINPLSSIFSLIIQIPVMLALYFVFLRGLPEVNTSLLYDFIRNVPINMNLFGFIDISQKSIALAIFAGAVQFVQAYLLSPKKQEDKTEKTNPSLKKDLAKSMQTQMKYVFPIIIGFVAYNFGGAVALYIITGAVFSIAQEFYVKKYTKPPTSTALTAKG